jgi:hypothetical protein
MKSIERRFQSIHEKNPQLSTFVCFFQTISKQNFKPQTIARWYPQLVEKDDYSLSDKKDILEQLYNLAKKSEDDKKQH